MLMTQLRWADVNLNQSMSACSQVSQALELNPVMYTFLCVQIVKPHINAARARPGRGSKRLDRALHLVAIQNLMGLRRAT